jgi:hypothetical protein
MRVIDTVDRLVARRVSNDDDDDIIVGNDDRHFDTSTSINCN